MSLHLDQVSPEGLRALILMHAHSCEANQRRRFSTDPGHGYAGRYAALAISHAQDAHRAALALAAKEAPVL